MKNDEFICFSTKLLQNGKNCTCRSSNHAHRLDFMLYKNIGHITSIFTNMGRRIIQNCYLSVYILSYRNCVIILVGGWWGQSIAPAFTRCMMKIKNIYIRGSLNKFPDFFVWALLLIVHTWNSRPLQSNLLRLQWTYCTVPTTLEDPMEVFLCERVNDLRHIFFHLLNCLITTASEFRE